MPDVITNYDGRLEQMALYSEAMLDNLAKINNAYHDDIVDGYSVALPSKLIKFKGINKLGGKTLVWNQLVNSGATTVATISGHKYYTLINGTANIVTSSGSAITIVDDTADMVFDLTLMFGAGNEPSTVEEFQQMFPADYYAYNEGTLLSAGVTDVESVGKNLADYSGGQGQPSNTAFSNATKRTFPIGKYIVGIQTDNYYKEDVITALSVTDNNITFTASNNGYGIGIAFDCVVGENYIVSYSNGASNVTVMWYAKDGTYLSHITGVTSSTVLTVPANAYQCVVVLRVTASNTSTTYTNIQIEHGTTASTYVPAKAPISYHIPASVQALDGYGWSAGSVYNYIDFERKVFVQRVGSVDMSDLTFGYGPSVGWSATLPNVKNPADDDTAFDGLSATLKVTDRNTQATAFSGGTDAGMVSVAGGKVYVGTGSISIVPSGTLIFELDEPVETDISAYLTDDYIAVEGGGTLTFKNQNGDDYRIPVPVKAEYIGL